MLDQEKGHIHTAVVGCSVQWCPASPVSDLQGADSVAEDKGGQSRVVLAGGQVEKAIVTRAALHHSIQSATVAVLVVVLVNQA